MTRNILHLYHATVEVQFVFSIRQVRGSKGHIRSDVFCDVELWESNSHCPDDAACDSARPF